MPSEHQVQVAARIINEVCRPGYRAALNLADRVLRAVEGQWATATGGPDHDGLTGKPFAGPTPVPCDHERELRRLRGTEKELITLSWRMHDAVDDKGSVAGSPRQYLDLLIAERDGLKILNDDLRRERDALALDKASRDGLISDLQAEVARLRSQLPSPPVHELEILSEATTLSGTRIEVKCPYPECHYEGSVHAPTGGLANQMADALARGHEEEMEEDPDAQEG